MPRPWHLNVEPWPRLNETAWYALAILSVRKAGKAIELEVEHRDEEQLGRRHTLLLPLPVRPEGALADFFRACGQEVGVASKLDPRATVGKTVEARLCSCPDGTVQAIAFRPLAKETNDEQPAE